MNDDLIRAETKVAYRGFVPDVVAQAFARGMRRARTMFASNNRECGDVSNGTFSWQLREANDAAYPEWPITRRAPFIDGFTAALKKHGIYNDQQAQPEVTYVKDIDASAL